MPKFSEFIGPSATQYSVAHDAERTINWYPHVVDGGGMGKSRAALYPTPGLRTFLRGVDGVAATALPSTPVRALWQEDGRCFAVAGGTLYEVFPNHTATTRGAVALDGRPATISSNGQTGGQLLVCSGGKGYVYDLSANTLTLITDDAFPPTARMGAFVDGYFVVLEPSIGQFQLSALYDGTDWNGLDVAQRNTASDVVVSLIVDHRELWLMGSHTSEVWFNNGNQSFPFSPAQGTNIENGIVAPFTLVKIDNSVFWLDSDERGTGIVRRAQGYVPQRISSHAVEESLRGEYLGDAVAWAYQDAGHAFYVLFVPAHDTTWVYDVATNLWHERALWDPVAVRWTPDLGRCHCVAFGYHLVGDRQSGAVYDMSLDYYDADVIEGE